MFHQTNFQSINDRFIPRRLDNYYSAPILRIYNNDVTRKTNSTFENVAMRRFHEQNYAKLLRDAVLSYDRNVLSFYPPKKYLENDSRDERSILWPVYSRSKPVIGPPEIVLDMPEFDIDIRHNITDWSCDNWLITVFEKEVHMWNSESEIARSKTNTGGCAKSCVKWDGQGKRFAIGLTVPGFGIWDVTASKLAYKAYCPCCVCQINCCVWLKTGQLITGCSRGMICIFSSDLRDRKHGISGHNDEIIDIQLSCNETYLCSVSLNKLLIIWKTSTFEPQFQIFCNDVSTTVAWHPWVNILAVGQNSGRILLYDMNKKKIIAEEKRIFSHINYTVDALTFNPITGELVCSYFTSLSTNNSKGTGVIMVKSNFEQQGITEELRFHRGSIPYLMWGKEGHYLASAGSDENLCIWKFLDNKNGTKNKKPKTYHKSALQTTIR